MSAAVGAQLAQRAQAAQQPTAAPRGAPMPTPAAIPAPAMQQPGTDRFDPANEHSASSTRVALSEAVGRALSVRNPENPRIRTAAERIQLQKLGIPDAEIAMLEANDPAIREG